LAIPATNCIDQNTRDIEAPAPIADRMTCLRATAGHRDRVPRVVPKDAALSAAGGDVPVTWSIIARDAQTGQIGVATASRFFGVGARVPFIAAQLGAVATQALLNQFYGTNGLRLLKEGRSAAEVVGTLVAADAGRDHRQVHVLDARNTCAAHTGAACIDWCGHLIGDSFSVAGNMLAGARVLEDTAATYRERAELPLARRLIASLQAGEAAGGDKRGKQAAGLVVYGDDEWPDLDLRVDDHADPIVELARLERVSRERWVYFNECLPGHRDPVGLTDRSAIEAHIAAASAANPKVA